MNNSSNDLNLFEDIQKKISEEKSNNMENKLIERNLYFSKNADISSVREEIQSQELSLRKSNRNDEFDNRRRFMSVINDTSTSIRSLAYFSEELMLKIDQSEVKEVMLETYIKYLKSTNLEEKIAGLIAIRKLLAQSI